MNSDGFPDLLSQPANANNHSRSSRSSTYRSCSYSSLPVLLPRLHLCQVYMIFLLQREGDYISNPQSTHIHYYTGSFLFQSIDHTSSFLCWSIYHTGSFLF